METVKHLFKHSDHPVHELDSVKDLTKRVQAPSFDANARNEHGDTPLHLLVKRAFKKGKEKHKAELIITMLSYSAVDMDIPDNSENTPLHTAVLANEMATVQALVVYHANLNAVNGEGKTPLDLAQPSSSQASAADDNVAAFLESIGAKRSDQLTTTSLDFAEVHPVDTDLLGMSESPLKTLIDLSKGCTEANFQKLVTLVSDMEGRIHSGARVLCLDGGGIKGLVQIELLSQLERATGKKVTELFDWIIGTSTGAILTLGLVYPKKSLHEMRQIFFKTRKEVFGSATAGIGYNTDALIDIVKSIAQDYVMSDVKSPKVLITAVDKNSANLKVRFFNNCFDDEYSAQEVWKVARYTSAAPTMFKEMDDYVDGGILASNPSVLGLAKIRKYSLETGKAVPLSLVVSIGTGINPDRHLGSVDAQNFLSFGTHWFTSESSLTQTVSNLTTVLGNAIVDTTVAEEATKVMCDAYQIPYFRFDPHLPKAIKSGTTDLDELTTLILTTKKSCREMMDELIEAMHMRVQARAEYIVKKRKAE